MKTFNKLQFILLSGLWLLDFTTTAEAASISVKNKSDAEVNFSAFGCGGEVDRGPIWSEQAKSLNLDDALYNSSCSSFTFSIYVGTWFSYTLDPYLDGVGRFPTGFRRVKEKLIADGRTVRESVWVAENGSPDQANRPFRGQLQFVLEGNKNWITVEEYDLKSPNKDWTYWDFRDVNLRGANLSDTKLTLAWFERSDLTLANLSGANLSKATLIETNLSWADLSHADLRGADLWQAKLKGARLTGSQTDNTTKCPNGQAGPCW